MKTLPFLVSLFFLFSCFLSLVFSLDDLLVQCLDDQRSSLLQLQRDLYYSPNFTLSSKFELWDVNTDCCLWEGVTCDAFGHVIGLDLSYKNISGSFDSIFDLHHLQHLNLAGNNFNTTLLSYGFDKLPNLTHLNLSSSCFHGQIPVKISFLTRLVSLDLSNQDDCYRRYYHFLDPHNGIYDYDPLPYELQRPLKLENPDFKTLIKNLRNLTELNLDGVDISFHSIKWCKTTSLVLSKLQVLSMSNCGLKGPLCSSLSELAFLSKLFLGGNPISSLPPNFLEISSRLVSLSLANCGLSGYFPTEILLLPKIQSIDLSANYDLMGELPEFPSNSALRNLSLSETYFGGKVPESIGNLKLLTDLTLSHCNFSGPIPSSIANLSQLVNLDLSGNNLSGLIPPFHRFGVPNLAYLHLGGNRLSGSISSSLFTLPSLQDQSRNLSFNFQGLNGFFLEAIALVP
ncbi:receptor-like protein 6 [Hibiscus syriacus]|uniref:receptor-like protein 6 n=1 Tax=Hibiscus syriacus TaxID=106335 RepID=UPI001924CF74|nr:receptor-like protein 6 [Hibiscus syriacus]